MGKPIGPGPGGYALPVLTGHPGHDATKYRNPQYSFGVRGGLGFKNLGPGPKYAIQKMTEHGPNSLPAWSFGSRYSTRPQKTPGPGAHQPEKCPLTRNRRPPVYSFGSRLAKDLKTLGPGPNAYSLKPTFDGNAYSMAKRLDPNAKPKSPGPAAYFHKNIEVYKVGKPKYSMSKRFDSTKGTCTPGPNAYGPNLYNTKDNPFKFSFGTRHIEYAPPMIVEADNVECRG